LDLAEIEENVGRYAPAAGDPRAPRPGNHSPPSAPVATKVRYTLQLASYQDKTAAENDVKKMKQRGYAAFIVSADVPGKGLWHRVRLGSFANKVAAEKLQKELNSKEGLSPIIIME